MVFASARDYDGETYTRLFREAMHCASPQGMADEVQDACEYIESLRVPNGRTFDRINNATFTITQVVALLVGRLAEAEAALKEKESA